MHEKRFKRYERKTNGQFPRAESGIVGCPGDYLNGTLLLKNLLIISPNRHTESPHGSRTEGMFVIVQIVLFTLRDPIMSPRWTRVPCIEKTYFGLEEVIQGNNVSSLWAECYSVAMRSLLPGVSECRPSWIKDYCVCSEAQQPEDRKAAAELCLTSARAAGSSGFRHTSSLSVLWRRRLIIQLTVFSSVATSTWNFHSLFLF